MLNPSGLICPLDQTPLALNGRSLTCERGHSFDLAKQGYCHLLPVQDKRSKDPGDSKAMVAARAAFLDSGVYQPIADFMQQQVLPLLSAEQTNHIADAGCGEGYYLAGLEQACIHHHLPTDLIGFDISKWAALKATRRSKSITWLVASNRQPPIQNGYLDLILCMFGFVQFQSFKEKLRPGGYLIIMDGGPNHLLELRKEIYEQIKAPKEYDAAPAMSAGFELISEHSFTPPKVLVDSTQIEQLMLMTPHFYRSTPEAREKLKELNQLELTLDLVCRIYQVK